MPSHLETYVENPAGLLDIQVTHLVADVVEIQALPYPSGEGHYSLIVIVPQPDTQGILIVEIEGYVYQVPFVREGKVVTLKTLYPSRKATKAYLKK